MGKGGLLHLNRQAHEISRAGKAFQAGLLLVQLACTKVFALSLKTGESIPCTETNEAGFASADAAV